MGGTRTWALVMDGVRARVLRGITNADGEGEIELISRAPSNHLRDILSDKAGRSFASDGSGRRSALEPGGDPVRRDMQDFAAQTAELLETHRRAGDFQQLAVLAEPRMLGILRSESPASLWATVVLDLPLNLIAMPERELRERVRELITRKP